MKRIYCISGLGADQRIFKRLAIPGTELVPLNWAHYDKHDDINCYAQKMAALIPEKEPTIIGLSFGGMVAVEITKQISVRQTILISSAKTINEIPKSGKFLQFIIKSKIIPAGLLTIPNRLIYNAFGATTQDEKDLLAGIIRDTDGHFVKWALKALLAWRNTEIPAHIFHIHGTADKIIPPTLIKPDYWVEGGEHIMVYNRAEEIGNVIAKNLR